jgi:hypothetical protein
MGDHYDGYAEADRSAAARTADRRFREMLAREGHLPLPAEGRRTQVCAECGEPVASGGYSWHHVKGITSQADVIALEGHLVEPGNDPNLCHACGKKIDFAYRENRYYHCSAPDAPWPDHKHLR